MPEGGRGKLFESIDMAECVRMELALMRAKPRCGHGMSFSKSTKAKLPTVFSGRQAAAI